jgi:hypothetical protein
MDDGIGGIIFFLVPCLVTSLFAYRKGYNGIIWFFALWFIGLLILVLLPYTNKPDLPEEEKLALKKKGNTIGKYLAGLGVVAAALLIWVLWVLWYLYQTGAN